MLISKTILRQAEQVMQTFTGSLHHCPDKLFFMTLPETEHSIVDIAIHALTPLVRDLGAGNDPEIIANGWPHSEEMTRQKLTACANYLISATIPAYLAQNNLADEDEAPQFFVSKLDRVMKSLRHLAQHTGEINWILRQHDIQRGSFL